MSSASKIGLVAVLIAAIGLSVWWVARSVKPEKAPMPTLGWKCSQCGERFQADLEQDAEAAFSETDAFPKLACPKCKADAYRVVAYRCTKCKHDFELTLAPDPKTGQPPRFVCPKCGDRRISPVDSK